uniref:Xrn1 N-terminal domain-containing protein n=1 Tax=viral metagenome TaxID=1070528 RepID=A0A6C0JLT1_9ZZZZ
MGIPFYFASLSKSHKGIIEAVKKNLLMEVDVFVIDFNCLIHRYLKDDEPISSILEALEYIVEKICKPKQLIIAMDGLVPYAKIVQQRYRRMRIKEEQGTFDRNQISPDTPYMRELEVELKRRFPYAIINGTGLNGEGEHKLIYELRKLPDIQRRSICIYGLDADLILIALQHHKLSNPYSMWLLRESAEFNDPKLKHAEFATLSIWKLLRELPMDIDQYMALGILCFGNDFMPNLGMFSLREDGYNRALQTYSDAKNPDLTTSEGRRIFLEFAAKQEIEFYKEKIGLRKRPEEKAILGKDTNLFSYKYGLHILDGVSDMSPVVEAFWKTFHWTWSYFKNSEPINWFWVYPYSDAPLVCDILKYSECSKISKKKLNFNVNRQLQFIMPSSSLRRSKRRILYPDELHSETRNPWMKRHDWEMKPRISLPWNPEYSLTTVSLVSD